MGGSGGQGQVGRGAGRHYLMIEMLTSMGVSAWPDICG